MIQLHMEIVTPVILTGDVPRSYIFWVKFETVVFKLVKNQDGRSEIFIK
jgi:hypothetical protein